MEKIKAIAPSDIGEVELDLDHLDNLLALYAEFMNDELVELRQDKEKSWQETAFLQRYDMADSLLRAIIESLAATRANVERLSSAAVVELLEEDGIPAAERKAAGSRKE